MKPKLESNSLGLMDAIIMGLAGSAPAFSLSAATVALISAVHSFAPAIMLYSALFMFGITLAFIQLNKKYTHTGASYAWVTEIFGPTVGFFTGWAVLVASALFVATGAVPVANSTLLLVLPQVMDSMPWVSCMAIVWITLIALITCKGIKIASYVQIAMMLVELTVLLAIITAGSLHMMHHSAHQLSWGMLNMTHFSWREFINGALIAVFLYAGWDVTFNLNEETKNARHTPGWGAFWAVLILAGLFSMFMLIVLNVMSDVDLQKANSNIVFAVADVLFPRPWSYLAVFAVILSTIGTIETSMLQFTRTLFAQGRDGVLHQRYAKLHSSWNTPWVANLVIWGISVCFLLLSACSYNANHLMKVAVNAVSFQIAFFYSLTGFAWAWYYRLRWTTVFEFICFLCWPIVSAVFLIFIALCSIPGFDTVTLVAGVGGILMGVFPLMHNRKKRKSRGVQDQ